MSDHADKAAEHAQHAGAHLGAVRCEGADWHLRRAQVEALLSIGQRLAALEDVLNGSLDCNVRQG